LPNAAAASMVSLSVDLDLKCGSRLYRFEGKFGLAAAVRNPAGVSLRLNRVAALFRGVRRLLREVEIS